MKEVSLPIKKNKKQKKDEENKKEGATAKIQTKRGQDGETIERELSEI